jgi:hypothetical protein
VKKLPPTGEVSAPSDGHIRKGKKKAQGMQKALKQDSPGVQASGNIPRFTPTVEPAIPTPTFMARPFESTSDEDRECFISKVDIAFLLDINRCNEISRIVSEH